MNLNLKTMNKLRTFWYLHFANPVVMKGELGGFKYVFRRFWLEVSTISGNFKARWVADEYPYAYLLYALKNGSEDSVQGFIERVYFWSMVILRDKKLVDDMDKALNKYQDRLSKVVNDEDEELALREVESVQRYVDADKKERKKMEKEADRKFKKALKKAEKEYPETGANEDE